jgi:hypothetical protein
MIWSINGQVACPGASAAHRPPAWTDVSICKNGFERRAKGDEQILVLTE